MDGLKNYHQGSLLVPKILRRYKRHNWGLGIGATNIDDSILYHQGGNGVAMTVGPDSHASAYYVDGVGGMGPFILSKDNPWIGEVGDNIKLTPYPPIPVTDPNRDLFRYTADVIIWAVAPSDSTGKCRSPIYKTVQPTTQTGSIVIMTQGRRFVRFSVDNFAAADSCVVIIGASKADLDSHADGIEGGVPTPSPISLFELPAIGGGYTVAASEGLYKELNVAEHGLSGADWISLAWASTDPDELPTTIRMEAFD